MKAVFTLCLALTLTACIVQAPFDTDAGPQNDAERDVALMDSDAQPSDAQPDTTLLGEPYRVGAHYYRSDSFTSGDYGWSEVTVRIYIEGELEAEFTRLMEHDQPFLGGGRHRVGPWGPPRGAHRSVL